MANLLQLLSDEIKEKCSHLAKKKALHQNNEPIIYKINELKFESLPRAPYSPDLAHSDYFLGILIFSSVFALYKNKQLMAFHICITHEFFRFGLIRELL